MPIGFMRNDQLKVRFRGKHMSSLAYFALVKSLSKIKVADSPVCE